MPLLRALPPEEPEADEFDPVIEDDADEPPVAAEGEDGEPRRKRRRRRGRGRDAAAEPGSSDETVAGEDAPQPSDEGLAVLEAGASLEAEPAERSGEPVEERGRRRRSRRGGRRGRDERVETETPREDAVVASDEAVEPNAEPAMVRSHDGEATIGEALLAEAVEPVPSAEMSPPAEVVSQGHGALDGPALHGGVPEIDAGPAAVEKPEPVAAAPELAAAEPTLAAEPEHAAPHEEPAPAKRPEPASSELDPARPKKSGWWSKAKAALGG